MKREAAGAAVGLACRCRRCPGDRGACGEFHVVDLSGVELFAGMEFQCFEFMRDRLALPYVVHFVGTTAGEVVIGGFSWFAGIDQAKRAAKLFLRTTDVSLSPCVDVQNTYTSETVYEASRDSDGVTVFT